MRCFFLAVFALVALCSCRPALLVRARTWRVRVSLLPKRQCVLCRMYTMPECLPE